MIESLVDLITLSFIIDSYLVTQTTSRETRIRVSTLHCYIHSTTILELLISTVYASAPATSSSLWTLTSHIMYVLMVVLTKFLTQQSA